MQKGTKFIYGVETQSPITHLRPGTTRCFESPLTWPVQRASCLMKTERFVRNVASCTIIVSSSFRFIHLWYLQLLDDWEYSSSFMHVSLIQLWRFDFLLHNKNFVQNHTRILVTNIYFYFILCSKYMYCVSQKLPEKAGPDKWCALLLILFWRRL